MVSLQQAATGRPSMGYEQIGLSVAENALTTVPISWTNQGWKHGLSETELKVVQKHYGKSFSKPEDNEFWANLEFKTPHSGETLDMSNPETILRLSVLGVMGYLSPNMEDQRNRFSSYKFVLRNEGQEEAAKASIYQKRSKAIGILDKLKETEVPYMIALCRFLLSNANGIKTGESAYVKLMDFLEGKTTNTKGTPVDAFLSALDPKHGGNKTVAETMLESVIQDAINYGIIRMDRTKQHYYNSAAPDSNYGRDKAEIMAFLTNPKNQDHLGSGNDKDAPYSVRYLIAKHEGKNGQ